MMAEPDLFGAVCRWVSVSFLIAYASGSFLAIARSVRRKRQAAAQALQQAITTAIEELPVEEQGPDTVVQGHPEAGPKSENRDQANVQLAG